MIPCVRHRDSVRFSLISPGGFCLLAAFGAAARAFGQDFIVTSGTDGTHSGPLDPHELGRAYDGHSKDFSDKTAVILTVLKAADPSIEPFALAGGYATNYFFMWLENEGTDNEHFHAQQRHGTEYPPVPQNNAENVQEAAVDEN